MDHFAVSVNPATDGKLLAKQQVSIKVRTRTHRPSILMPCLILFFVMSIFFYVWTKVHVVQLGYAISSALEEEETSLITNNELKLEIATLRSAQHLEKRVKAQLGMDLPKKDQLIIIR
jgi:cell division protein FtsL